MIDIPYYDDNKNRLIATDVIREIDVININDYGFIRWIAITDSSTIYVTMNRRFKPSWNQVCHHQLFGISNINNASTGKSIKITFQAYDSPSANSRWVLISCPVSYSSGSLSFTKTTWNVGSSQTLSTTFTINASSETLFLVLENFSS